MFQNPLINKILNKVEGQTIATIDGGAGIIVTKQYVYPEYVFEVKSLDIVIKATGKNIIWESFRKGKHSKDPSGYLIYRIVFRKEFDVLLNADGKLKNTKVSELNLYIEKGDVDKFEELLKIVCNN